MAKYGFSSHPKLLRLAAMLSMPVPHVLGHLTMLWEASYRLGDRIGDAIDVENLAAWQGARGVFAEALLSCGGAARSGFLDADPERPGCYLIHDLFDNAPRWVSQKAGKDSIAELDRTCDVCGNTFHSTERHAKHCSGACKQKAWRLSNANSVTDVTHVTQPVTHVTELVIRGEFSVPKAPPVAPRVTEDIPYVTLETPCVERGIQNSVSDVTQCYPLSVPLLTTTTTTTCTEPSADAAGPKPTGKARKSSPRGKTFSLATQAMTDSDRQEFERAWDGYPQEAWNFSTKTMGKRRLGQNSSAERFNEIVQNNNIGTPRGPRLTARDLADLTLYFVQVRKRQAEAKGEPVNVPAIGNFFSAIVGQKNHWLDAANSWIKRGCPSPSPNPSSPKAN